MTPINRPITQPLTPTPAPKAPAAAEPASPAAPAVPAEAPAAAPTLSTAIKAPVDASTMQDTEIDPSKLGDGALPWEADKPASKEGGFGFFGKIANAVKGLDKRTFFMGANVEQHFNNSCTAATVMEQYGDKHPEALRQAGKDLGTTGTTTLPNGEKLSLDESDKHAIDAYAASQEPPIGETEREQMYMEAALMRQFSDGEWSAEADLDGEAQGLSQDQLMDMAGAMHVKAFDVRQILKPGGILSVFMNGGGLDPAGVAKLQSMMEKLGMNGLVITVQTPDSTTNHAVTVTMNDEGQVSVVGSDNQPYPAGSENPRAFEDFLDQLPSLFTGDVGNTGTQYSTGGTVLGSGYPRPRPKPGYPS